MIELYGAGQRLFECDIVVVNHGTRDEPDFQAYIGGHRQWKAATFGLAQYEDPDTNHFVISREALAAVRCARDLPVQTVEEYFADIDGLEELHILLELKHHGGGMPHECMRQIREAICELEGVTVTVISFNHQYLEWFPKGEFQVGIMLRCVPNYTTLFTMIESLQPAMILFDQFVDAPVTRRSIKEIERDIRRRGEVSLPHYIRFGAFTVNDIPTAERLLGNRPEDYNFVITDSDAVMLGLGDLRS